VAVVHLDPKSRIGQHFSNGSFQLDCFFFCHNPPLVALQPKIKSGAGLELSRSAPPFYPAFSKLRLKRRAW
jgi:hypothetical protein